MSFTLSSSNVDAIFSGTQSGNAFSISSSLPVSVSVSDASSFLNVEIICSLSKSCMISLYQGNQLKGTYPTDSNKKITLSLSSLYPNGFPSSFSFTLKSSTNALLLPLSMSTTSSYIPEVPLHNPTSIEILTPPNKTTYLPGETFNPTGMVVRVNYADNTSSIVSDYSYSTNPLTYGMESVRISYPCLLPGTEVTCTTPITVLPTLSYLEVISSQDEVYEDGESFLDHNHTFLVHKEDGSTYSTNEVTISPSLLHYDDNEVEVTYSLYGEVLTSTIPVRIKCLQRQQKRIHNLAYQTYSHIYNSYQQPAYQTYGLTIGNYNGFHSVAFLSFDISQITTSNIDFENSYFLLYSNSNESPTLLVHNNSGLLLVEVEKEEDCYKIPLSCFQQQTQVVLLSQQETENIVSLDGKEGRVLLSYDIDLSLTEEIHLSSSKMGNRDLKNPAIQLDSGELFYSIDELSFGSGLFSYTLSHSYLSSKGFFLSSDSHIEIDGNDLLLIDEEGYSHKYIWYKTSNGKNYYHDEEGLFSTIVYPYHNGYLLSKNDDSHVFFDEEGRLSLLAPSTLALSDLFSSNSQAISFVRVEGRLEQIYCKKDPLDYLYFEYDSKGRISSIGHKKDNSTYKRRLFSYDDKDRIIKIRERMNEQTRDVVSYSYLSHSLLSCIEDLETGAIVSFVYDSLGRVHQLINEQRILPTQRKVNTYKIYTYQTQTINSEEIPFITTTEAENGFITLFEFDRKGYITSSFYQKPFEEDGLFLLEKSIGKNIPVGGTSLTEKVNDSSIQDFEGEILNIPDFDPRREGDDDVYIFSLSMLVRLDYYSSYEVRGVASYCGEVTSCSINKNAVGVFQRIALTIKRRKKNNEEEMLPLRFGIYDSLGNYVPCDVVDCFTLPCNETSVQLHENQNILEIEKITDLQTSSATQLLSTFVTIYGVKVYFPKEGYEFTLSDMREYLYLRNQGIHEITLGGGRKRFTGVQSFLLDNQSFSLFTLETCKAYTSTLFSDKKGKAQTFLSFSQNQYENNTHTIIYNEEGQEVSSSDRITHSSRDGKIQMEEDEYGIYVEYTYDSNGNLLNAIKRNHSDNKYEILAQGEYDSNGKYLLKQGPDFERKEFTYSSSGQRVTSTTSYTYSHQNDTYTASSYHMESLYDDFEDKTLSVKGYLDQNIIHTNEVTYDKGRVETITDSLSSYQISYDFQEDSLTVSESDGNQYIDIHTRKTSKEGKKTKEENIYQNSENEACTLTSLYDPYGKMLSYFDSNTTFTYEYDDSKKGSPAFYPIKKIHDPTENKDYIFSYNNDGKMCSYTDGYFSIRQLTNQETQYRFGGFAITTKQERDPQVPSSDRLVSFSYGISSLQPITYTYDSLGRLFEKKINSNSYQRYTYLEDGDRSISLVTEVDSHLEMNQRVTNRDENLLYDANGNISHYSLSSSLFGIISYQRNTSLTYDDASRILSYSFVKDTISIHESFTYNSASRINTHIKDNITYTYHYSLGGRLTSITSSQDNIYYSYDRYGNVTQKSKGNQVTQLSYERGNLLNHIDSNIQYFYNHNNIRCRKVCNGITTEYYYDKDKLIAENRGGTLYYYLYDESSISGFRKSNGSVYLYLKDAFGNVTSLYSVNDGKEIAHYVYDSFGKAKVYDEDWIENNDSTFIGNINVIRFHSHYYDLESGFYYMDGRYYDIDRGSYLDAIDADDVIDNALTPLSLDRNGISLRIPIPSHNFATALSLEPDSSYDPDEGITWFGKYFFPILGIVLQSITAVVCFATGNPVGGVLSLIGVAGSVVGLIFGEKIAGAINLTTIGIQAIWTGIQSCFCGCVPIAILGFVSGLCCLAFASAEMQEGLGYGNWIKDIPGMNDSLYNGLKIASSLIATAINMFGPKCFKEGTIVKTEDGDKKIEDIKVGDKVLSKNPETGEIAYKKVTKLYRNETHVWVTIHLGKKIEITTTLLHAFFVSGVGLRNAFTLKQGSQLIDKDGNTRTVTWVDIKRTKFKETHKEATYNIEVEDFHTYFVSSIGIWVSNTCIKYYEAKKVGDDFIVGREISLKEAKYLYNKGHSIFVNSTKGAKKFARTFHGFREIIEPVKAHGIGYYYHFHPTGPHEGRHVFIIGRMMK